MIVIVGESGSGKSTIEKMLQSKGKKKIISITTRQPRAGEVDGVDYHFTDYVTFLDLRDDGKLAEYTHYNGNYYGILKEECVDDSIAVVELNGLKQLLANKELNIVSFYLQSSEEARAMFMLERGDSFDNVMGRILRDREHFIGVDSVTTYTVTSEKTEDLETIVNFILNAVGG